MKPLKVEDILKVMGSSAVLIGDVGSGNMTKLAKYHSSKHCSYVRGYGAGYKAGVDQKGIPGN